MLLQALKTKAGAYLIGGIAVLVFLMAGSIWMLRQSLDAAKAENARLDQAMSQAKVTNDQNLAEIQELRDDIRWRDQQAVARAKREQDLNDQLAQTVGELKELVKDAPCSGPEYLWPDAVYERMRAGTVADPQRIEPEAGASGIPYRANPASPAPAD